MDENFWRGCLDVQIDPDKLHGEPTVGPYRVAARTVVECDELGDTPEEIADEYGLPLEKVKSVLGFTTPVISNRRLSFEVGRFRS